METSELKSKFLDLLKKDEEFRLAVAGLIGLDAILNELKKLHEKGLEHDKRFEAIEKELLEQRKSLKTIEMKLLEHDKRFEMIERKLLEHDKRFEAIEKKLLEHDKRLEAIEKKLLEHDKRFEAIERELISLNKRVSRLEDELGALTEATTSWFVVNDIKALMEEGERILSRIRNARVDDEDIDLLIETNMRVYVVEIKVKPKVKDVGALLAKAEIVRKKYPNKEVKAVLAGLRVKREVQDYARGKNVIVMSY